MNKSEVEADMNKSKDWLRKESKKRGLEFIEYKYVAIGYLDITEEYQKGIVSQTFVNKLHQLWSNGLGLGSLGHHTCEFCEGENKATSCSEKILIDKKNKIEYKLPEMIFHYIEEHNYQPPEDFVLFVLTSQIVDSGKLIKENDKCLKCGSKNIKITGYPKELKFECFYCEDCEYSWCDEEAKK